MRGALLKRCRPRRPGPLPYLRGECDAVVKSDPDIPDFCWTLDDLLAIFVGFRPT